VKVKIKKGDTVEVISGRYDDKGRRGEVIKVLPKNGRVTVQGVSMRKKHQSQVQTQGRSFTPGIIEFEGPGSSVMTRAPPNVFARSVARCLIEVGESES